MNDSTEKDALRFSMLASAIGGAIGVAFALASGSDAVLLDGVYSLVSFGMALAAERITRLIIAPSTVHFPFGKAALEPVVNAARSGVILVVLAYAAFSAIGALSGGGEPTRAGPAVVYGGLIGFAGLAVARRQDRIARESGSAILAVDAASWRADGAISLSVGAAFVVAVGLDLFGFDAVLPFVDPITVLVLVAWLIREPYGELRSAAGELLVEAPPVELQQAVFAGVDRAVAALDGVDREIKLWKLGRHLTVRVTLLVPDGQARIRYADLDDVRQAVRQELDGIAQKLRVDVLFTADPQWLDPRDAESETTIEATLAAESPLP